MFQVVHADEPGRKKKRKRKPVSSAALCQGQSESLLEWGGQRNRKRQRKKHVGQVETDVDGDVNDDEEQDGGEGR